MAILNYLESAQGVLVDLDIQYLSCMLNPGSFLDPVCRKINWSWTVKGKMNIILLNSPHSLMSKICSNLISFVRKNLDICFKIVSDSSILEKNLLSITLKRTGREFKISLST